jgi:hypothetical protein
MHKRDKRKIIEAMKREIAGYLDELDGIDDVDLWEEASGKLFDVLLVYRRAATIPVPTEDQIAQLTFRSAVNSFASSAIANGRIFGASTMPEPTMPEELWMFWCSDHGTWATSIDDARDGRTYLVSFSEEQAVNAARHQNDNYFENDECVPVRIRPTPGPATRAMLELFAKELEFVSRKFSNEAIPKGAGYGLVTKILVDNVKAFLREWGELPPE